MYGCTSKNGRPDTLAPRRHSRPRHDCRRRQPHRDHRNQAGGPDIHDDEKVHDAHHNREWAAAAQAAGGDDIDCGHLPA
ncbi:hypothetical protein Rwratislav_24626 [Rhodococcus wratislaviensis IFP 2016]|nr:hypothetical protein Rwratislav_24626 [Rhodococcus wratislaviensis IFP 2016]